MEVAEQVELKVPKLRFREFEGEWEKKTLGDVGKIRMCRRIFNHETAESGDIPFYKIGTFGKTADAFITEELYSEYRTKFSFPKIGDILISAAGTLGRTVIYDGSPAYFQDSNIVWIDNNEDLITNSFLYYVYETVRYDSEGGTIQRLYNSIISSAKFCKPSLSEQQKIAGFLSAVDEKLKHLNRKKELLKQYKKGVMQQLFAQELRFKREDGSDYENWKEKRLGEVCNISAGGDIEKLDFSKTITETHIYPVFANALTNKGLNGYSTKPKVTVDSVTVTGRGDVGYAEVRKGGYTPVVRLLVLVPLNKMSPYFSMTAINHINIHKESTGVPQLTAPQLSAYTVPLPQFEEQQKIAAFLSSWDRKIDAVSTQIELTQQFKKGLLQEMFV